jgi:hypothetical protein
MNVSEPPGKTLPRKYLIALLIGAVLLLGWIFSGYMSVQMMIDFVMRYCS